MASIIEDLLSLMSPEEQASVRAKIADKPELAVRDRQMNDLFSIYLGEDVTVATPATPAVPNSTPAPAPAATPATPAAAAATVTPSVPSTTSTSDNAAILEKLTQLSGTLESRLADLDKKYVPVAKLGEYRTDILASAIKTADDYSQIRESHKSEFNENLDRTAFEKFVQDKAAAGARYATLAEAHDSFVTEKRVAKRIEDGVAAGVKQKTSGATVPGQTQSVALSPALQAIAKAREAGGTGGEKTNATVAAERLRDLVRGREGQNTVQ